MAVPVPLEKLKSVYDHLFRSDVRLSKIKDSTLADRLYPHATNAIEVSGRSLAWKLFLCENEPLDVNSPPRAPSLLASLRTTRKQYADLLLEKTRAPDGSYDKEMRHPNFTGSLKRRSGRTVENLDLNNPLSLHDENPWNDWFASVELRKTISQDVERTFPEIAFFRSPEAQTQLTDILFLHSVMYSSIGYRQGMHELLAPIFYAVSHDSIPGHLEKDVEDSDFRELCSGIWVAADAWALFERVMQSVSQWYEWREPDNLQASSRDATLPGAVHFQLNAGRVGLQPYVSPIVQTCNRIQSTLLRAVDPSLWKQMQTVGTEPQIYGIRWLRLLFTREFSLPDAMKIWDCLYACDPTLHLAEWICVAMLIRVRNDLITSDYSGQLTTVLRYPSLSSHNFNEDAPHHTTLLLRQALALQMSPTPSTGVTVMIENRNLLNIPLEVPPTSSVSPARRTPTGRQPSPLSTTRAGVDHSRQYSSGQIGLPEMIARGLLEKGESLGINKTLMNAVSELRRNIPDLAATLQVVRSPNQTLASFPLEDERLHEERPPWEPRTRFEIEKEINETRSRDKRLGSTLAWIVDVLLLDDSDVKDKENHRNRKREALESLSYVRDVLISNATTLDEERLLGEEEFSKRKSKELQPSADGPTEAGAMVSLPPPVPIVHTLPKSRTGQIMSRSPPSSASTMPMASPSRERKMAPWNYTHSSFSSANSVIPSGTLPRLPPPTSTSLRRNQTEKSGDQTPPGNEGYRDPLGALR